MSGPIDQAAVRALCLALPEATEQAHMGTPDFRVGGKIFATLPPRFPGRVHLKATPADVDALTRAAPDAYRDVWGGRWIGVELSAVAHEELVVLLHAAYRLTAPRRLAARLPARLPAAG